MSNTISSFTDLKWKLFRVMKHYIRSLFHLLPFCNRMPSVLMLTKAFLPSRILASDKIFFLYCVCTFFILFYASFFKRTQNVKSIKISSNPTWRELTFCLFYLFISHSLMTFSRRVQKEKELVKN